MNALGPVQSRRHVNFARDPLLSYLDEPQKNEIYFLNDNRDVLFSLKSAMWNSFFYIYIFYVFYTTGLCIIFDFFFIYFFFFLYKVCKLHDEKNVTNRRIRSLRSTAVVMTWRQSGERFDILWRRLFTRGRHHMISWRTSMYEPCWSKIHVGSSKESLWQCKYYIDMAFDFSSARYAPSTVSSDINHSTS